MLGLAVDAETLDELDAYAAAQMPPASRTRRRQKAIASLVTKARRAPDPSLQPMPRREKPEEADAGSERGRMLPAHENVSVDLHDIRAMRVRQRACPSRHVAAP